MTKLRNLFVGVFGLALGFGVAVTTPGCGAADAVDEAYDCNAVCSKYKDCLGGDSYDVSECRTKCRDKASMDTDFKRKADICQTCISDRSCKDATIKCVTECAGIVP